jgi:hypothetical protein
VTLQRWSITPPSGRRPEWWIRGSLLLLPFVTRVMRRLRVVTRTVTTSTGLGGGILARPESRTAST